MLDKKARKIQLQSNVVKTQRAQAWDTGLFTLQMAKQLGGRDRASHYGE